MPRTRIWAAPCGPGGTAWNADQPPVLRYWSAPGFVQIYDGRRPGQEGTYTFEGVPADIYRAVCDRPRTTAAIQREAGRALAPEAVREILDEFGRRGLVFRDGDLTVALATPAGAAVSPAAAGPAG